MKNLLAPAVALGLCLGALADEPEVSVPAENPWRLKAGGDFRLRQELMDNLPGNPGDP